jgi:hypothetical protein
LEGFKKEQVEQLKEQGQQQGQQLKELAQRLEKLQVETQNSRAAWETYGKVGAALLAVAGILIPLFGDELKRVIRDMVLKG